MANNTTILYQPQEGKQYNQYNEPLNPNGQSQSSYNTTILVPKVDDNVAAPAAVANPAPPVQGQAAEASHYIPISTDNNNNRTYNGYPGNYNYAHPTPVGPPQPHQQPQGPGQPAPIKPEPLLPPLPPPLCACCSYRCRQVYFTCVVYVLLGLAIGLGINSIVIAIDDLSVLNNNTNVCISGTSCEYLLGIIEYNDCCTCYSDIENDDIEEIFAAQCNVANIYAEARIITFIIQIIIGLVCFIALCYKKYNILWSFVIYLTIIIILAIIVGAYVGDAFFWATVIVICVVLFGVIVSMAAMIKTLQVLHKYVERGQPFPGFRF